MTIARLFHGEKVRLTAFRHEDLGVALRWEDDSDYLRQLIGAAARPRAQEQVQGWYKQHVEDKDGNLFAIRLRDSDTLVGFIELDDILWNAGSAWYAIGIGDRNARGKGYGTEATRLALQFAFDELNLHRVQLTVFAYNEPAIRVYERCGFQREGVFRDQIYRDGVRYDSYLYGILRPEWEAIIGRR
jgi:RimJ/RimL family protein N-acetyltransferase